MATTYRFLPDAGSHHGLTMVIDTGLPIGAFADLVDSHGELFHLVKFGWGTALVTRHIREKVALLRGAGIGCYFGGTLFEHAVWTGQLAGYLDYAGDLGVTHLEVSNGTIPLDQSAKAGYVRQLSRHFQVLSEVGFKDPARSEELRGVDWVCAVEQDLEAGAALVTLETRESGRAGVARPDGTLRPDVMTALFDHVDPASLLFEAPTKGLQCEVLGAVGPEANLANIAPADVVGVETLRLGLRSDTLLTRYPQSLLPASRPAPAVKRVAPAA